MTSNKYGRDGMDKSKDASGKDGRRLFVRCYHGGVIMEMECISIDRAAIMA